MNTIIRTPWMCPVWFNMIRHHCCYNCKDKMGDSIKWVNKEGLQSLFADKIYNKDLAICNFVKVLKIQVGDFSWQRCAWKGYWSDPCSVAATNYCGHYLYEGWDQKSAGTTFPCSTQITKQSEMQDCTVVQQCTLTTSGKALIFAIHQITRVKNFVSPVCLCT